jgi:hypothetical protein
MFCTKKISKADIMHDKIVGENVQNFSWGNYWEGIFRFN